jgi:hypothetical protein
MRVRCWPKRSSSGVAGSLMSVRFAVPVSAHQSVSTRDQQERQSRSGNRARSTSVRATAPTTSAAVANAATASATSRASPEDFAHSLSR